MPSSPAKAKKPQDHKAGFGKKSTHRVELPSGNTVTLERPGIEGLVRAGILESFDALTSIVQGETIPKAEGRQVADLKATVGDIDNVKTMTEILNKITIHVVAEPKLSWPYLQETDEDDEPVVDAAGLPVWVKDDKGQPVYLTDEQRDEDAFYIDYVDIEDKTFIMNFAVGGSSDLQRFRESTQEALGSVRDGEAASETSE